ncbi:hypothetical protein T492DRAFT_1104263 [Pavlovales sp. CCMP2436]|nr:hypothetical protein T492DRAFT_1104263 [Pavlovales sp. CCMP2436]
MNGSANPDLRVGYPTYPRCPSKYPHTPQPVPLVGTTYPRTRRRVPSYPSTGTQRAHRAYDIATYP